ncbi:MAG: hypothetical protein Q7S04_04705 [Candidatus Moranbacteria bacterium]|nr:hypothetical protein [Candidatus Moranbacteria bacterium]
MSWIGVALFGYFFNAVTAIFDKYLLAERIKTPAVYAFFVSLFSLFVLIFIPFGFRFFNWQTTGIFLFSGALFLYGLVALYTAVKESEISRITPLVGTVVSLVAIGVGFFPGTFSETAFSLSHIVVLVLLIGGGLLISFDLPLRKQEHISSSVVIAGVAMGVSLLLLKYGYADANFVSGLIWSRIGMFLAGLSLFLVPTYRGQILNEVSAFSGISRSVVHTGAIFVMNKLCAGGASLLIIYATYLGPVSFVQALSGMQYVFLLLLALPLSLRYPQVFGERLFFWDWFQKACAIIIIGLGLWLSATSGIKLLV